MGFWIFMALMSVLTPVIMLGFGGYFKNHAPAEINDFFGYRTKRSMRNHSTWQFAHNYCGRIWLKLGWIQLAASLLIMALVFKKDMETVGMVGGILVIVEAAIVGLSVIPVEHALKKNFDQWGIRKGKSY